MGCNSSKSTAVSAPKETKAEGVLGDSAANDAKPNGSVEVHGATGSMNAMAPILLATASKCGKMVACMPGEGTKTPEFLSMNPFQGVPTLKDGELSLGESSAILRYLAEQYAPDAYPKGDAKRRAFIDWAMDRFATGMYQDAIQTIYVCLGYAGAPEDQAKAGKECTDNLAEFADVFLKEKFVGGERLSIADYKLAPFFFAYGHPSLKEKCSVEIPDRIKQFNKDFAAACTCSEMLTAADGHALKELLDAKHGSVVEMFTEGAVAELEKEDLMKKKKPAGKGKVEIHGTTVSANCGAALMFAKHTKAGDMVQCMPGEATRTPEFLAMNPFHHVPTLKDGDFCLAESNAILRYLAQAYAPEFYPTDAKKRAQVDWAMDRFSTGMYNDAVKTLYVALGFRPAPAAQELAAAGKAASENLEAFAKFFLQEKFVAGESLSIADFKVAPFFAAYGHPLLKEKCSVELPDRIKQFNEDFAAACAASSLLQEAGGYAIKEMLDAKAKPEAEAEPSAKREEVEAAMAEEGAELVPAPQPEVELQDEVAPVCGCFGQ